MVLLECLMLCHGVSWCLMLSHGVLSLMVFLGVLRCLVLSHGVLLFLMMLHACSQFSTTATVTCRQVTVAVVEDAARTASDSSYGLGARLQASKN